METVSKHMSPNFIIFLTDESFSLKCQKVIKSRVTLTVTTKKRSWNQQVFGFVAVGQTLMFLHVFSGLTFKRFDLAI